MPPSLLGVRDGGNAAQAVLHKPRSATSGRCSAIWRAGPTVGLQVPPGAISWSRESIGRLPMSEPNGSNILAEGDAFGMARSRVNPRSLPSRLEARSAMEKR